MTRRTRGFDLPTGIRRVHGRDCAARPSDDLAVCSCRPRYQAQAGPRGDRRTRTFDRLKDAQRWRAEVQSRVTTGNAVPRLADAAERWVREARAGTVLTRTGDLYRAATITGYEQALAAHVLPALGRKRLDDINRGELLAVIGAMRATGARPSTVRNAIVPVRSIFRWANDNDTTVHNPTRGLAMPGVSGARRTRFAEPAEIAALIAAAPEGDRPIWATAAYAGLRRGELRGLRTTDVDLGAGIIRVRQSWVAKERRVGLLKTETSRRDVPISAVLRPFLEEHLRRADGFEFFFARGTLGLHRSDPHEPFHCTSVRDRGHNAWRAAGLEPIGFHECRHAFGSTALAAGVSMKQVSAYLGHSSIQTTMDIYAHLSAASPLEGIALIDEHVAAQQNPSGGVEEAPRSPLTVVPMNEPTLQHDPDRFATLIDAATPAPDLEAAQRLPVDSVATDALTTADFERACEIVGAEVLAMRVRKTTPPSLRVVTYVAEDAEGRTRKGVLSLADLRAAS